MWNKTITNRFVQKTFGIWKSYCVKALNLLLIEQEMEYQKLVHKNNLEKWAAYPIGKHFALLNLFLFEEIPLKTQPKLSWKRIQKKWIYKLVWNLANLRFLICLQNTNSVQTYQCAYLTNFFLRKNVRTTNWSWVIWSIWRSLMWIWRHFLCRRYLKHRNSSKSWINKIKTASIPSQLIRIVPIFIFINSVANKVMLN